MNTREWALVLFTILTEMSVGSFIVLGAVYFFVKRQAGEQEADRMTDRVLIAIGAALVLGFLASLLHLGNPINAPKAVVNFQFSWLSREILLGVIFAVLGGAFVALQWFKKGSVAVRNGIALAAALVGVAFVYSQSKIYMLEAQPSWNHWATPVSFFATTLLLGVLAIGAAMVANFAIVKRQNPECTECQFDLMTRVMRWLALSSILLVGVEIVVTPLYLAALGTASAATRESLQMLAGPYNWAFILRMVLGFVGAVVLAAFLYQNATSSGKKFVGSLAVSAFALVLVAEVLARYVFYATHYRLGI